MLRIFLCVLTALSVLAGPYNVDVSTWEDFKVKHNKEYNAQEDRRRYEIFSENLKEIEEHNALYNAGMKTYEKAVNHFTDMSDDEFHSFLSASWQHRNFSGSLGLYRPSGNSMPESIDYRQSGALNPIRSQGECGACWAFAAVACLESNNFLRNGVLLSLSEQNLVDCSFTNFGCYGGLTMYAYNYIRDNGLEALSDYPYIGTNSICRFDPSKSIINVKGYQLVTTKNEQELKSAVAEIGPVAVSVDARELQLYKSGIFISDNNDYTLNHAAVIVGYGSENGRDYWIVRNSWSQLWGEQGYVRIARNHGNQIGIADYPIYPIL